MELEEFLKIIPLAKGAEIASWHECGLIAIDKKAGIKTHPNSNGKDEVSAVMAKYNFDGEYFSWIDQTLKEKFHLYLINRIDSPTSGLILAASNKEVAEAAKKALREKGDVQKTYMAIVCGKALPKNDVWSDTISEKSSKNYVRSFAAKGGSKAVTNFRPLCADENRLGVSLVELKPKTGLTHQLRVQCAKRRIPILGDRTYGNFDFNRRIRNLSGISRMFLHCSDMEISFCLDGEKIEFKAHSPLPESFDKLIKYNNQIAEKLIS